jgi:hypothetical protein
MSLSERVVNNDEDVGPAFAAPIDSDENSHTSASSKRMLQSFRLFVEGMGILWARQVRGHPDSRGYVLKISILELNKLFALARSLLHGCLDAPFDEFS